MAPQPLPRRLTQVPILEATAEIRFQPAAGMGTGDLLPGYLFTKLRDQFAKLTKLPLADVPDAIRLSNPELKYAPTRAIRGQDKSIQIGDRVVGISVLEPYVGWQNFKPLVEVVWKLLSESKLVTSVERISLKYTNLLQAPLLQNHFALTNVVLQVGNTTLTNEPTLVRTEVRQGGMVGIVQIMSQATGTNSAGVTRHGLLLEVDVLANGPLQWQELSDRLEAIHTFEKTVFFELLSEETLRRYGPQY